MKLSPETIAKLENARDFDFDQIQYMFNQNCNIIWSWGPRNYTRLNGKGFSFRVSGRHFKGYVSLTVNDSDLYDIDFSNNRGNLKDSITNVYVEDIINVIDGKIENVSIYKR